jgi:flagellar hook-associated protein 1 FlgK
MTDFSALHVALSGLRAAQVAMDTASHNVSNANTPGFTRQRVNLSTNYPRYSPVGQLGLGVQVTDISRIRDNFLDVRFRMSSSANASVAARSDLLSRAELILAEPDLGVSVEMTKLWDAFEDLALNPPDEASRVAVIEQLGTLASRVRSVATGLVDLADDGRVALRSTIDETNALLEQVAALNISILDASAQSGGPPNDLMDKRDILLDELSTLVGATSTIEGNGSVRVSIGGISLVSGPTVRGLSFDASTDQIIHASGVAVVPGGEARGLQTAVTSDIPAMMSRLDTFAVDLATALNTTHAAGFTAAGAAGGDLLTYNATRPALSLDVAVTSADQLAAAASAGPPYPQFDATTIEALADLRTGLSAAAGTRSLGDSYRSFVTALGQEVSSAMTSSETQAGLVAAAGLARDSAHGVSVDEEMVNLMEFQRMYEAAARVVTAVDQALDTVINRMGVVGR